MKWRQPRPTSSAKTAALVVAVLLAIFLFDADVQAAAWKITFDGADVTGPAAPLDRQTIPLVNVVALGPAVALAANVLDNQLEITDAAGVTWKAANGDISLRSDSTAIPLKAAVMLQGNAAYLPVDALAEVANLKLEVDSVSRAAVLSTRQSGEQEVADGWEPLVVAKPAEATGSSQAQSGRGPSMPKAALPPGHDHIHTSLGLGYVQGTDFGAELLAYGRTRGVDTQINGLLTYGQKGLRPYYGRILLKDQDRGWIGEGGGLYSDIFGLAYGVRYARKSGRDRWPALSLYVKSPNANLSGYVLACRDEIQITKTLAVGGELASNASYLAKGRLLTGRLSLYGYNRHSSADGDNGTGFFVSYDLGRGIYLNGGMSRSASGGSSTSWRDISLRVPLTRQIGLTFDRTDNTANYSHNTTSALMVDFPLGPLRLLTRYQIRDSALSAGTLNFARAFSTSRQLQVSAAYFASPAVNFDYQVSTFWLDNGANQSWQQLVGSFRLGSRTQLQAVMGMPDMFDAQHLRVRLNHDLTSQLSLSVDYGQLMPFQGVGAGHGARGVMVMVRRQWNMSTPARGGLVRGVVTDQLGRAMPGVVVTLNQYRVVTDKNGRFACRNMPSGSYEVCLAGESLPADYTYSADRHDLVVGPRTDDTIDMQVVPLNSVAGRICFDTSRNSGRGPDEGVAGIALEMDGFPTASGENGSFGFYNVAPGKHLIKLLVDHLPAGYGPASPTEVEVTMKPDSPITGLEFRLVRKEKEIEYQDLP